MCGIAGIVALHGGSLDRRILGRMIETLGHRGPDAQGIDVQGPFGLANRRLSIIDLPGGSQPMRSADGNLCITFNGEIFNYIELREELEGLGHNFATHSDTEVILHAYQEYGEDCVHKFNGQWGFAIADLRNSRLFISRDRLGVRPVFYTITDNMLIFGSEIKAIFTHPAVRRELDFDGLDQIFTFWHAIPPKTAFRGICELPPGSSLSLNTDTGDLRIDRYWDLDFDPSRLLDADDSTDLLAQELLNLLVDATRLRLRSDVPVGAYLSGGLDSSAVVALISNFTKTPLRTFSVAFEEDEFDESGYQREVVRRFGTDHSELHCNSIDIADNLPDVIWHTEQPILRTAPVPLFMLSERVHRKGFKVVLTGEGADEVFGGYDIFKEAKIRRFIAAQPNSKLRMRALRRLYPYMPQIQRQSDAYLKAFFHVRPDELNSAFFSHLPRWDMTSMLKRFYSDDVAAERREDASSSVALPEGYGKWPHLSQAQYLETKYLLPGYILSSQGDRVAMAHSVEGRFPFLDYRVVEFASRIPPRLKLKVLNEKYLLKRAVRELLPKSVLKRKKQPYRAPTATCFFQEGGPDYVEELLSTDRLRRDAVFDPPSVQALVQKFRVGRAIGVKDQMALTGILTTGLLLDQFIHHFARNSYEQVRQNSAVHC